MFRYKKQSALTGIPEIQILQNLTCKSSSILSPAVEMQVNLKHQELGILEHHMSSAA